MNTEPLTKIGITSLPKSVIQQLKSGNKTELFDIKTEGRPIKAALSAVKLPDGNYQFKVHPERSRITSPDQFSSKELESLSKGRIVSTKSQIHQLDPITKEMRSIEKKYVQFPEMLHGQNISNSQKKSLLDGKTIEIKSRKITLDLNSEKGFSESLSINPQASIKSSRARGR